MEITEKVAYLKGLMEGMKIDTETNEGKILSAMVDILEDIGLELEDLWNAQGELEDGLVHISQVCDKFIRHPSEAVSVGDVVNVVVLEVDEKKKRISLSMKQAK